MKQVDDGMPNDETADALRRLVEYGSDLSKPLEMDFHVSAPTEQAAKEVARLVAPRGFKPSVSQDEFPEEGERRWTCTCTTRLVPSYETVSRIERELDVLARPCGAFIDGFGSFGNADDES